MRIHRYVRIAFTDPVDPDADYLLTDHAWPATPEGLGAAAKVAAQYNHSPDTTKNYIAVEVIVSPPEDDRVVNALRRLTKAVCQDSHNSTVKTKERLEAAFGAASMVLCSLGRC